MPLKPVTRTQTLIDSLWEINAATEQSSWTQKKQTRQINNKNNGDRSGSRSCAQYHIERVLARMNAKAFIHKGKHITNLKVEHCREYGAV